jgi:hypothetical protein
MYEGIYQRLIAAYEMTPAKGKDKLMPPGENSKNGVCSAAIFDYAGGEALLFYDGTHILLAFHKPENERFARRFQAVLNGELRGKRVVRVDTTPELLDETLRKWYPKYALVEYPQPPRE